LCWRRTQRRARVPNARLCGRTQGARRSASARRGRGAAKDKGTLVFLRTEPLWLHLSPPLPSHSPPLLFAQKNRPLSHTTQTTNKHNTQSPSRHLSCQDGRRRQGRRHDRRAHCGGYVSPLFFLLILRRFPLSSSQTRPPACSPAPEPARDRCRPDRRLERSVARRAGPLREGPAIF
jgi:hypothetical protein